MADISQINIPSGGSSLTYNLKDASVPHSSLPAASGGTDLSLVTTGEKADWVDKTKVYQVEGTKRTSTVGDWTGVIDVPALYDGLLMLYCAPEDTYNDNRGGIISLRLTLSDGTITDSHIVVGLNLINACTGQWYLFRYSQSEIVTVWEYVNGISYEGNAVDQLKASTFSLDSREFPILLSEEVVDENTQYVLSRAQFSYPFRYSAPQGNLTVPKVNGYTLNNACAKDVDTTVTSGSSNLVTSGAVYTAIDNLPEPMVFKGTLGTGGTITTLPTASSSNEGYTYKVITAGTYASQSAKVGDVFVSNGSAWVLIPSGDTDTDTWRSIKVNGTALLGSAISTGAINFKSGTNTTVSGSGNDITISSTDTNTTYSLTQNASDGHKITLTPSSGTAQTITIPDNNTTYTLSTSGNNVVLTPSSGSANTITVPYATNAGKVNNLTVQTAVPTNAKFTDTTYTFANGTNGFTVTPSGGTAQTVTVTPSITNNVTGSGTSGYIAKFNGANTITNGVALGSSTTTFLRNDGTWATPPGGTDTKNTAGSTNNTGKLFLVGALEQSANPQTYSNSGVSVKGNGELSSHTWSVKNSNDYSRAECYVDAEDRGRINVYDENGIGRIKLIGNSGVTLNDSSDTTTIFLDSEEGRVECDKMSYTHGTVTFSKSSGSWTFANGEYTRSGQVVQLRLSFKGGSSNVSVGSNAIAGTVNGISKPPYTVRLQGYYSGTVLMGELTTSGGFNVRILGQALNLSSSNTATMSGTYIVED